MFNERNQEQKSPISILIFWKDYFRGLPKPYILRNHFFKTTVNGKVIGKLLIAKCRCRLNRKSLETIYRSFTLLQLDYADVIWDNCSLKLSEDLESYTMTQ